MAKRQEIQETLGSLKRYDIGYDYKLSDLLAAIGAIVGNAPTDQVSVNWIDGDDCESGYIEFDWRRPETDQEMSARVAREKQYEQQRKVAAEQQRIAAEQHERETYERLKFKYESGLK